MPGLLIAAAEHNPPVGHGVILIAVVLIAGVGAVVRLVLKSRAARTPSDPGPEGTREPAARGPAE